MKAVSIRWLRAFGLLWWLVAASAFAQERVTPEGAGSQPAAVVAGVASAMSAEVAVSATSTSTWTSTSAVSATSAPIPLSVAAVASVSATPATSAPSATPPLGAIAQPDRGLQFPIAGLESPKADDTATALRVVLGITLLAVVPALLVCVTAFLRIIIVLSMLRHALGMQETPPNSVLIGLALFLTLFTMAPVAERVNQEAFTPFMHGKVSMETAYDKGISPVREFMLRQTREEDIALMVELSRAQPPKNLGEVSNVQLIPAFMLSELRAAFQIGFMIFLPFLLIDLIVSSVLMSLGMMMMPPVTVSLPIKVLMFILVDGWTLLLRALVGSFH